MTQTYNENVIINDNLEVNGTSDEVQVIVKGASTQTEALQQWKDNSGTVLSEIDGDGHLLVGDEDGTIDALIESHNLEDPAKPSRGLHSKGVLTGTLSSLVSWVVQELGLKGTGGISALHRALRVQVTNENTGDMDAGADVRAGDFEAINMGGDSGINNLEMSALVAKLNNQSGAYLDKAYGLKVEIDDAGSSNDVYAIYTDNGIVHLGDLLELVAGVVLEDSASDGVLGITPRSVAPTSPTSGMMYLDNGTNRADGLVGFRRWNGSSWDDIVDTSNIGTGSDASLVVSAETTISSDTQVNLHWQKVSADYNLDGFLKVDQFVLLEDNAGHPSTPTTDEIAVYNHSGVLYLKDDAGVETPVESADWFGLSGVSGTTSYASGWNAVELDTEDYDPDGNVSLTSNQFVLPSGDWLIHASVYSYGSAWTDGMRIYNATSAANAGSNDGNEAGSIIGYTAVAQGIICQITSNGTDAFELQIKSSATRSNNNGGVYAMLTGTKI